MRPLPLRSLLRKVPSLLHLGLRTRFDTWLPLPQGMAWCRLDAQGRICSWRGDSRHFLGLETRTLLRERPALARFLGDAQSLDAVLGDVGALQRVDQTLIAVHVQQAAQGRDGSRLLLIRDATADLSLQGELMESEAELRLVFDAMGEAVFVLSLDGTIRKANAAARSLYGEDVVGKSVDSLRRPGDPSPEEALRQCFASFGPSIFEQHLPVSGRTVELYCYPVLSSRGTLRQLLLMEHDVTSERMMALEIRVQHQKLQDSLRKLREVDQAKTRWLHSVSHELRTPLTSIRSYSELLLSYPDTDLNTRAEFAGIIKSESERLGRLIDELLDLAAIESGHLTLHLGEQDLAEVAQSVLESLRAVAAEVGVFLRLHKRCPSCRLHSDRDRLQQVVINLVGNAIKFSPQGSEVLLTIDQEGEHLRLWVEDEGPGIPPADRRRIFKRFAQLGDDLTGKPKGTGLGLTISGELAARLGGSLRCTDPQHLSGACFMLNLPLAGPGGSLRVDSSGDVLNQPSDSGEARAPHSGR